MSRTVSLFASVLVAAGLLGAGFAAPASGSAATQARDVCAVGVKVATVAGIEPTALPAAIEKKAQACAKFSARKGLDAVVTVRRNPTATDIKWALLLVKAIRQAGGSARYEGPASAARAKPAPCEPDYAACISAIGDLPING